MFRSSLLQSVKKNPNRASSLRSFLNFKIFQMPVLAKIAEGRENFRLHAASILDWFDGYADSKIISALQQLKEEDLTAKTLTAVHFLRNHGKSEVIAHLFETHKHHIGLVEAAIFSELENNFRKDVLALAEKLSKQHKILIENYIQSNGKRPEPRVRNDTPGYHHRDPLHLKELEDWVSWIEDIHMFRSTIEKEASNLLKDLISGNDFFLAIKKIQEFHPHQHHPVKELFKELLKKHQTLIFFKTEEATKAVEASYRTRNSL